MATAPACGRVQVDAAGETRTIWMYHIHTQETISVLYKKDGKYVPEALKKIRATVVGVFGGLAGGLAWANRVKTTHDAEHTRLAPSWV